MGEVITFSFCDNFIKRLKEYIVEKYILEGRELNKLAIVFGGKRPSLFLKKYLAGYLGRSFSPPMFFTIDEFVSYILDKHELFCSISDLDNCYMLYTLAKEFTPDIVEGRKRFSQFLPWSREILRFVNNIDMEDVDNKSLCNIEANAQIGYSVPDDINQLLENISRLRDAYHRRLTEKNQYSRGYRYLQASRVIDEVSLDEFSQILFCNFFYFHKTEEKIVKSLYDRGLATLIFQGDERKWPILQRMAKRFCCNIKEGTVPSDVGSKLHLYSVADVHAQTGVIREILQDIKEKDKTVIVVPNPENLVPLLSEIGDVAGEYNVSMGYPVQRSSLYMLFLYIFKAQLSRKSSRYYSSDYLKVILHPLMKNLDISGNNIPAMRIISHKIEEILSGIETTSLSGSLFIRLDDIENSEELFLLVSDMLRRLGWNGDRDSLREAINTMHSVAFLEWEGVSNFRSLAEKVRRILSFLFDKGFISNYPLNATIAEKILSVSDEFAKASFAEEIFTQEELFKIFLSKLEQEMVSFVGAPLKGLQILGLFETRSLSFDNVIIMDVNEGILPSLRIYEPLIPREIMLSLNLDRLELEEEMQRYQFMRLISSAKKVYLVFQESRDKERSRFIEELIWEEQKKTNTVESPLINIAGFNVAVNNSKRRVKKTSAVLRFLENYSYSASSINTYIKNPLDFYYKYVLGLKQQDDLLEEPDARLIGTLIHGLLEQAFRPFIGKRPVVDDKFRRHFFRLFDHMFEQTFGRSMRSDLFLLKTVMIERLSRFIDNESLRNVKKILFLENRFEDEIELVKGKIKFKYIIDRIDLMQDGSILLIDYKTGSIEDNPYAKNILELGDLSREKIKDKIGSIQIPLYFYYLDKLYPDNTINASVYSLRTLEIKKYLKSNKVDRIEVNKAFLELLSFIIDEILDPDVDFIEDED